MKRTYKQRVETVAADIYVRAIASMTNGAVRAVEPEQRQLAAELAIVAAETFVRALDDRFERNGAAQLLGAGIEP